MQSITQFIETLAKTAFKLANISDEYPVLLMEATNPKFGDYQINGIMKIAKDLKTNPINLANLVISNLDHSIFAKIDVAGPGFINLTLTNEFLVKYLNNLNSDNHFGTKLAPNYRQTIVVDMSSPNLAKEMHVGHLRSTVIGDALANIYNYLGHQVIRQNHVGDWGTQFGMLITYFKQQGINNNNNLADLEQFYRKAKLSFDKYPDFANQARENVVRLQKGDPELLHAWREFCHISLSHANEVYTALQINLTPEDIRGESFYNPYLAQTVSDVADAGLLVESKGAKCVFFTNNEFNNDTPLIIQKQDGGYLYATTDLAAIKYRVYTLLANRIVYVIDSRQSLHLEQVFNVAKCINYAKNDTLLEHCAFGTVMGEDNKPFKTREGTSIKLMDLVNTAITKAKDMLKQRNEDAISSDIDHLAHIIAISSIKYADLSKNRTSDYVFNYKQMLAFEGNTAPYLLYAYTRIQSIFAKAKPTTDQLEQSNLVLTTSTERMLALHLAKFADNLFKASQTSHPHFICNYLYELATYFMRFYENCPILNAQQEIKYSRLRLSHLTSQILATGLALLGINTVDKM